MKSKKKNARGKTETKAGRPTKINQETVRKLEMTASLDCTISEMCFYADISRDTYYRWMKENKELSDRLTALRNRPILKARQEVINGLEGNPEFALKYLERKLPDEFGTKQKLEHLGDKDKPVRILYVPAKRRVKREKEAKTKGENCQV